ncbi:MAG: hypothetical protein IJW40_02830 [Clostridia bacterium]|nr:hypothetical protein [Clostridia bacterium]
MIRYLPFKERLWQDEVGFYDTYGIRALDESGSCVALISDVSTDEPTVVALCDKCTRGQLAPLHLYDVVEDFLGV